MRERAKERYWKWGKRIKQYKENTTMDGN